MITGIPCKWQLSSFEYLHTCDRIRNIISITTVTVRWSLSEQRRGSDRYEQVDDADGVTNWQNQWVELSGKDDEGRQCAWKGENITRKSSSRANKVNTDETTKAYQDGQDFHMLAERKGNINTSMSNSLKEQKDENDFYLWKTILTGFFDFEWRWETILL